LVEKLGINEGKKHEKSPTTMIFAVLSLVLSNYTTLKPVPVANE
jgi:hypothetical protein